MESKQENIRGPEYVRFGKNVAAARQSLGLSQRDIAKKLGMGQSTYAGYETGTRKVPLSVIIQLSQILNKTPDELIGYSKQNNNSINIQGLEKDLVLSYRNADEVDKTIVKRTLNLGDESPKQKNA